MALRGRYYLKEEYEEGRLEDDALPSNFIHRFLFIFHFSVTIIKYISNQFLLRSIIFLQIEIKLKFLFSIFSYN